MLKKLVSTTSTDSTLSKDAVAVPLSPVRLQGDEVITLLGIFNIPPGYWDYANNLAIPTINPSSSDKVVDIFNTVSASIGPLNILVQVCEYVATTPGVPDRPFITLSPRFSNVFISWDIILTPLEKSFNDRSEQIKIRKLGLEGDSGYEISIDGTIICCLCSTTMLFLGHPPAIFKVTLNNSLLGNDASPYIAFSTGVPLVLLRSVHAQEGSVNFFNPPGQLGGESLCQWAERTSYGHETRAPNVFFTAIHQLMAGFISSNSEHFTEELGRDFLGVHCIGDTGADKRLCDFLAQTSFLMAIDISDQLAQDGKQLAAFAAKLGYFLNSYATTQTFEIGTGSYEEIALGYFQRTFDSQVSLEGMRGLYYLQQSCGELDFIYKSMTTLIRYQPYNAIFCKDILEIIVLLKDVLNRIDPRCGIRLPPITSINPNDLASVIFNIKSYLLLWLKARISENMFVLKHDDVPETSKVRFYIATQRIVGLVLSLYGVSIDSFPTGFHGKVDSSTSLNTLLFEIMKKGYQQLYAQFFRMPDIADFCKFIDAVLTDYDSIVLEHPVGGDTPVRPSREGYGAAPVSLSSIPILKARSRPERIQIYFPRLKDDIPHTAGALKEGIVLAKEIILRLVAEKENGVSHVHHYAGITVTSDAESIDDVIKELQDLVRVYSKKHWFLFCQEINKCAYGFRHSMVFGELLSQYFDINSETELDDKKMIRFFVGRFKTQGVTFIGFLQDLLDAHPRVFGNNLTDLKLILDDIFPQLRNVLDTYRVPGTKTFYYVNRLLNALTGKIGRIIQKREVVEMRRVSLEDNIRDIFDCVISNLSLPEDVGNGLSFKKLKKAIDRKKVISKEARDAMLAQLHRIHGDLYEIKDSADVGRYASQRFISRLTSVISHVSTIIDMLERSVARTRKVEAQLDDLEARLAQFESDVRRCSKRTSSVWHMLDVHLSLKRAMKDQAWGIPKDSGALHDLSSAMLERLSSCRATLSDWKRYATLETKHRSRLNKTDYWVHVLENDVLPDLADPYAAHWLNYVVLWAEELKEFASLGAKLGTKKYVEFLSTKTVDTIVRKHEEHDAHMEKLSDDALVQKVRGQFSELDELAWSQGLGEKLWLFLKTPSLEVLRDSPYLMGLVLRACRGLEGFDLSFLKANSELIDASPSEETGLESALELLDTFGKAEPGFTFIFEQLISPGNEALMSSLFGQIGAEAFIDRLSETQQYSLFTAYLSGRVAGRVSRILCFEDRLELFIRNYELNARKYKAVDPATRVQFWLFAALVAPEGISIISILEPLERLLCDKKFVKSLGWDDILSILPPLLGVYRLLSLWERGVIFKGVCELLERARSLKLNVATMNAVVTDADSAMSFMNGLGSVLYLEHEIIHQARDGITEALRTASAYLRTKTDLFPAYSTGRTLNNAFHDLLEVIVTSYRDIDYVKVQQTLNLVIEHLVSVSERKLSGTEAALYSSLLQIFSYITLHLYQQTEVGHQDPLGPLLNRLLRRPECVIDYPVELLRLMIGYPPEMMDEFVSRISETLSETSDETAYPQRFLELAGRYVGDIAVSNRIIGPLLPKSLAFGTLGSDPMSLLSIARRYSGTLSDWNTHPMAGLNLITADVLSGILNRAFMRFMKFSFPLQLSQLERVKYAALDLLRVVYEIGQLNDRELALLVRNPIRFQITKFLIDVNWFLVSHSLERGSPIRNQVLQGIHSVIRRLVGAMPSRNKINDYEVQEMVRVFASSVSLGTFLTQATETYGWDAAGAVSFSSIALASGGTLFSDLRGVDINVGGTLAGLGNAELANWAVRIPSITRKQDHNYETALDIWGNVADFTNAMGATKDLPSKMADQLRKFLSVTGTALPKPPAKKGRGRRKATTQGPSLSAMLKALSKEVGGGLSEMPAIEDPNSLNLPALMASSAVTPDSTALRTLTPKRWTVETLGMGKLGETDALALRGTATKLFQPDAKVFDKALPLLSLETLPPHAMEIMNLDWFGDLLLSFSESWEVELNRVEAQRNATGYINLFSFLGGTPSVQAVGETSQFFSEKLFPLFMAMTRSAYLRSQFGMSCPESFIRGSATLLKLATDHYDPGSAGVNVGFEKALRLLAELSRQRVSFSSEILRVFADKGWPHPVVAFLHKWIPKAKSAVEEDPAMLMGRLQYPNDPAFVEHQWLVAVSSYAFKLPCELGFISSQWISSINADHAPLSGLSMDERLPEALGYIKDSLLRIFDFLVSGKNHDKCRFFVMIPNEKTPGQKTPKLLDVFPFVRLLGMNRDHVSPEEYAKILMAHFVVYGERSIVDGFKAARMSCFEGYDRQKWLKQEMLGDADTKKSVIRLKMDHTAVFGSIPLK